MSISSIVSRLMRRSKFESPASIATASDTGPLVNPKMLRCRIAYNTYGAYCLPESSLHRPASKKIVDGDIWEPDTISYLRQCAAQGDVIHAGTYFGDFLPAIANALRADGTLWAFEPHPENYRCAAITTALNGLANVQLTHAGLGASPDTLNLKVADEAGLAMGGGSRIATARDDPGRGTYVPVRIVRLDDVIPTNRHISVLQLDVERFEQPALAGALETIRRCRPAIIVEHMPDEAWFVTELVPLAYKISGQIHANTLLLSG